MIIEIAQIILVLCNSVFDQDIRALLFLTMLYKNFNPI